MHNAEQVELHIQVANAKNQGNDLLTHLLDCVRCGNFDRIRNVLIDKSFSQITRFIIRNNLSFAQSAFQYISPQIVRASLDGGLPWMDASKIYQGYTRKAAQMNTNSADVRPLFSDVS